jgi:hypothetical protein
MQFKPKKSHSFSDKRVTHKKNSISKSPGATWTVFQSRKTISHSKALVRERKKSEALVFAYENPTLSADFRVKMLRIQQKSPQIVLMFSERISKFLDRLGDSVVSSERFESEYKRFLRDEEFTVSDLYLMADALNHPIKPVEMKAFLYRCAINRHKEHLKSGWRH